MDDPFRYRAKEWINIGAEPKCRRCFQNLKEVLEVFKSGIKLPIKEKSARHFTMEVNGTRLMFLERAGEARVEFYVGNQTTMASLNKSIESTNKQPSALKFFKVSNGSKVIAVQPAK